MSGVAAEDVKSYETALAALCGDLDPVSIPLSDAATVYESLAHIEKLAAGAKLLMARRVEESKEWRRGGYRRAADWMARTSGTSSGAAQAELETSQRVASLSGLEDAVRNGDLSTTQANAVADAAVADPGSQDRLVETAKRSTVRELRDECARTKAAADPNVDARHARICRERSLRTFTDHDGAWNLHARGPVDAGAKVMAALQPLIDAAFTRARREGRCESHDAYSFDALVTLADQPTTPTAEQPQRRNVKHLALLRVDVEALVRGAADNEEVCEITGLGPIPVRVARDLLGESILKLVITRGSDVAAVVNLGRRPSAAQKIALLWSQPTCSRLGCDQPWTHTEIDHRTPWADTHQTVLGDLDRLCKHDHRLKHHDGWALVPGSGKRTMVPPDHPLHPNNCTRTGADPPEAAVLF